MSKPLLATLLGSVALFVSLSPAEAQQAAPIQLPTLSVGGSLEAEESGLHLNLPASTGSRLDLTPKETAAAVETISAATVRERGYASVNEVAQRATGFTSNAAAGNGGSSLVARGFSGHGSVMQLYDGTRLYVASGTVTFPFDTWSVDRVEILRGPASVLYGEGAIGGVVNVVSKKPNPLESEHEMLLELGSDLTRRAAVSSAGPLGGKLSYYVGANARKSAGYVDMGENGSEAFTGAVRLDASDTLNFTLSHDTGHQNPQKYWGTPLRDRRLDKSLREKNYNVSDSDIDYLDNWTQFKMDWQLASNLRLRNNAYYFTSNRHWRDVESYLLNPATNQVTRTDYIEIYHDQEQIGNRTDLTIDSQIAGMKNQSVIGFDVNRVDFTHINNTPYGGTSTVDANNPDAGLFINQAGTLPRHNSTVEQYSLFVEDRLVLNESWSLAGGLRFDRIDFTRDDLVANSSVSKTFNAFSWRAGAVYNLNRDTAFYGQYATAVSPVGSSLLGQSAANTQLELSTAEQFEIGVKQDVFGGRGAWTLAAYHITKNKLQTRNPTTPTVVEQIGQQSSRGVEVSAAYDVSESLRLEANAALLEAQYDDYTQTGGVSYAGKRPPNTPEQVANLWATWRFAPEWKALGAVRYVGDTYSNDANTAGQGGYFLADLGLSWSPVEKATVSLRVLNLFDKVYGQSLSADKWVLGMPRTAYITTSIKF